MTRYEKYDILCNLPVVTIAHIIEYSYGYVADPVQFLHVGYELKEEHVDRMYSYYKSIEFDQRLLELLSS